eukprot:Awhi_evm1s12892
MPPPPPPPGPPPPPVAAAKMPSTKGRGDLLSSIQKGTKLKKAVTVDKSGPVLGGVKSGGGS